MEWGLGDGSDTERNALALVSTSRSPRAQCTTSAPPTGRDESILAMRRLCNERIVSDWRLRRICIYAI